METAKGPGPGRGRQTLYGGFPILGVPLGFRV